MWANSEQMQTNWVSARIITTYQCTFPLCFSGIPVIRGQYADCNLDMRENVPKRRVRGGWTEENNGVLIPQEAKSCQMPPLSNQSIRHASSVYLRLISQNRVTCQHTDPEMETWEVKNEGGRVSGRTSNSVYKQYARVYHQNVCAKQCTILYSLQCSQKCVGVLKHVCVGVPKCDCNCVWDPLMWPS